MAPARAACNSDRRVSADFDDVVVPGLVPGIRALEQGSNGAGLGRVSLLQLKRGALHDGLDGRDKPGHDGPHTAPIKAVWGRYPSERAPNGAFRASDG